MAFLVQKSSLIEHKYHICDDSVNNHLSGKEQTYEQSHRFQTAKDHMRTQWWRTMKCTRMELLTTALMSSNLPTY